MTKTAQEATDWLAQLTPALTDSVRQAWQTIIDQDELTQPTLTGLQSLDLNSENTDFLSLKPAAIAFLAVSALTPQPSWFDAENENALAAGLAPVTPAEHQAYTCRNYLLVLNRAPGLVAQGKWVEPTPDEEDTGSPAVLNAAKNDLACLQLFPAHGPIVSVYPTYETRANGVDNRYEQAQVTPDHVILLCCVS